MNERHGSENERSIKEEISALFGNPYVDAILRRLSRK